MVRTRFVCPQLARRYLRTEFIATHCPAQDIGRHTHRMNGGYPQLILRFLSFPLALNAKQFSRDAITCRKSNIANSVVVVTVEVGSKAITTH